MIRVGIIGATGYAGGELVRILLNHKDAKIVWYGSRSYIDKKYYQVYQNMFQLVDDICKDELAKQVDVIFTATPQGFLAGLLSEEILSQVKIVDLSADYRIKDVATYEKWYGIEHKSPQFIEEAVYGLCEINRDKITEKTRLVANPGCYHLLDPDCLPYGKRRYDRCEYPDRGCQVRNFRCRQRSQSAKPVLRSE